MDVCKHFGWVFEKQGSMSNVDVVILWSPSSICVWAYILYSHVCVLLICDEEWRELKFTNQKNFFGTASFPKQGY